MEGGGGSREPMGAEIVRVRKRVRDRQSDVMYVRCCTFVMFYI